MESNSGSGSGSGPFRPPSGQGFGSFGGAANQQFFAQPSQQQRPPQTFGNRPRPVPVGGSSSNRGGAPQPFRGRGGGNVRPASTFSPRPVPSSSSSFFQPDPSSQPSQMSSATASHRPRPFTNRSTVFNKPDGSSSAIPANTNSTADPAPSFDSQSAPPAFSFNSFGSQSTPSSAFGSSSNTFGPGSGSFGVAKSAEPPTPLIQASSSLQGFSSGTASNSVESQTLPPPSAIPASTFNNFLRRDRSGASTPLDKPSGVIEVAANSLDEDEQRKKRFEDAPKVGNRWLEMKAGREALRASYIKSGVLPDPDKPTDLALAVKLSGTCLDMCPEYEREEREFQKELDPLEMSPGTDRVDARSAVKIYRRPAAGRELPLPDDVRPPPVLKETLDYLFHNLLPSNPTDPRFTAVQGFIWNRTRAVRQDFIVQSEGGAIAIECHERIARYHVLCLHWRGGPGSEGWSEQQELEQLRKTLRSLIEFYDDRRRSGQSSPNEAEFRSYNLLLHLRDPETLREAELLPGPIFRSSAVQSALNLRHLAQRSNNLEKRGQPRNTEATLNFFSKFFAELNKPNVNYLMACLAENSFASIRIGALKAMSKAYMSQHRAMPIETVQKTLGLDDAQQVIDMAQHLGVELEWEDQAGHRHPIAVKIDRNTVLDESKPLPVPFSSTLVEAKRRSYTNADVVDGRASGAVQLLPNTAPSAPSTQRRTLPPSSSIPSAVAPPAQSLQPSQPAVSQSKANAFTLSAVAPTFKPSSAAIGAPSTSTPSPSFSFAPAANKAPSLPATSFGAPSTAPAPTKAPEASPFTFGADPSIKSSPKAPVFAPLPSASIPTTSTSFLTNSKDNLAKPTPDLSKPKAAKRSITPPAVETTPAEKKPSAADVAHAAEVQRRTLQRKEAARKFAVQKAGRNLIADFCVSASKRAASTAVERELLRRRDESRQKLLTTLATRLLDNLVDEQSYASAERAALEAAGDTFSFRCLTSVALNKWKAVMADRRDRGEQQRRLQEIRTQLRRRNVLTPMQEDNAGTSIRRTLLTGEKTSTSTKSKRKFHETRTNICSDDELRSKFLQTRQKRAELWEEGSMLSRLADHIDELFLHFKPADLDQWTAVYSGAGTHVASRWLRLKFGFQGDQGAVRNEDEVLELDLADGSRFQLVDTLSGNLDVEKTGEEVGMLVFELNPAIAQASSDPEREKLVQEDRVRLEALAQSASLTRSLLSCRLLLISWGNSVQDADTTLLDHFGFANKSSLRQSFDKVGVLELSDASVSPEIALSAVLQVVMPDLQPNPRRPYRWSLQDVTEGLYDQWVQTATLASGLLAGLPASEADAVACKTVQILTALANHILRTVISLSDTVLEDDDKQDVLVPMPSSETSKGVLAMALNQIDTLSEEQALLLRSKLVTVSNANEGTEMLAVDQHMGALFMLSLDKLSSVWIQMHDEAQAASAIQTERETLDRLCRAAIDEISATSRSIWTRYRAQHASPSHSHDPAAFDTYSDSDVDMEPIESRERRSHSSSAIPRDYTTEASLSTSTSITNLRALVARTTAFLNS